MKSLCNEYVTVHSRFMWIFVCNIAFPKEQLFAYLKTYFKTFNYLQSHKIQHIRTRQCPNYVTSISMIFTILIRLFMAVVGVSSLMIPSPSFPKGQCMTMSFQFYQINISWIHSFFSHPTANILDQNALK